MIVGHYATALIPRRLQPEAPFWLLLLASNLSDFLWILLGLLGLEAPRPSSLWLATFQNIAVEMPYSHDGLPTLLLAIAFTVLVLILFRNLKTALWCGVLVIVHLLCDLLSGYPHHLAGNETAKIGLGLYNTAPHLALFLEALVGGLCVAWYLYDRKKAGLNTSRKTQTLLYLVFVGGALIWLPTATLPLGKVLGVSP